MATALRRSFTRARAPLNPAQIERTVSSASTPSQNASLYASYTFSTTPNTGKTGTQDTQAVVFFVASKIISDCPVTARLVEAQREQCLCSQVPPEAFTCCACIIFPGFSRGTVALRTSFHPRDERQKLVRGRVELHKQRRPFNWYCYKFCRLWW